MTAGVRRRQSRSLPEYVEALADSGLPARVRSGMEDVEFFPGSGKGHIHLIQAFAGLTDQLLIIGRSQRLDVGDGNFPPGNRGLHGIGNSGGTRQPGHNDDRGFQPLGLVNGHNAHGIQPLGHGNLFRDAEFSPVLQEKRQTGSPGILRGMHHFQKTPHKNDISGIAPFHLTEQIPFPHNVIGRHQTGLRQEGGKQPAPDIGPLPLKLDGQGLFMAAAHAPVMQRLPVKGHTGQLLHDAAGNDRPEGHIVCRRTQEGQKGHCLADERMRGKQQAVFRYDGDARFRQRLHQRGRFLIGPDKH